MVTDLFVWYRIRWHIEPWQERAVHLYATLRSAASLAILHTELRRHTAPPTCSNTTEDIVDQNLNRPCFGQILHATHPWLDNGAVVDCNEQQWDELESRTGRTTHRLRTEVGERVLYAKRAWMSPNHHHISNYDDLKWWLNYYSILPCNSHDPWTSVYRSTTSWTSWMPLSVKYIHAVNYRGAAMFWINKKITNSLKSLAVVL